MRNFFMKKLAIIFLLVCAPIFAVAQGGAGQSNYPVSQITVQNNGTPLSAVNGALIWNLVSGCTATVSGSQINMTCTGGGSGTVSANSGSPGAIASYAAAGGSTTVGPDSNLTDASNTLTYSGTSGISAPVLTSTVAIGTPPLVVTSTTNVPNLNAATLNGNTFAVPGAIGSTTPNIASFTNLSFSGNGSHLKTFAANKDITGTCTMTSGACTLISFSTAYTSQPACMVTWDGITGTLTGVLSSHSTTSGLTPTSSVGTDTAKVFYICVGNPN
jgi:hypothetical protein